MITSIKYLLVQSVSMKATTYSVLSVIIIDLWGSIVIDVLLIYKHTYVVEVVSE